MALALWWIAWACGDGVPDPETRPPNGNNPDIGGADQDILTTDLALDLAALSGRATITAKPATETGNLRLDVAGLDVHGVVVDGEAVQPFVDGGVLTVTGKGELISVVVDYAFPSRTTRTFDGWMPELGVSFVWPYHCHNLFPCDPALDDGVVFSMDVAGVEAGKTAIFPASTVSDSPAYMPGIAVGDYTELSVGTTSAGTTIKAWYLPNDHGPRAAERGTAHLVQVFDYFETTYGPYAFGSEYGSVEVNWGADSYGGMEHHPYSHIGSFDMNDEEVHAHEAGHGWFGDGVRIGCWEDFVLSEGTTTYIAARAMDQVGDADLWAYYVDDFLEPICRGHDVNTIVLPDSCNEIDLLNDDLWSLAPYMKGACFYEDVGDLIGPDALDQVIGAFYVDHVNGTARMTDMIQAIEAQTDPADRAAVQTLVDEWLLTEACPHDYATRCRARQPR